MNSVNRKMDKYLSLKLQVISFFLMIMVVYLHSYNAVIKTNAGNIVLNKGYSLFIQDFISHGITRTAVPLFFAISGYLFFLKMKGTSADFVLKLKKRMRTLVVPYLFWSAWGLLFYFILQNLPKSNTFFTNKLIKDYSINEFFSTIFLNPIPYQLWFVRDLIVIVILSPIIYWSIRHLNYLTLLVLSITWFADFDLIIFSNEALLFFVFGASLSVDGDKLEKTELPAKSLQFSCLWLALVLFKTVLTYVWVQWPFMLNIMHKISILVGLLAIWTQFDFFFKNRNLSDQKRLVFCSFSFFLFASHEPILSIFKKSLVYFFGKGELGSLLIYLAAPILTIIVSLSLGYYLKQYVPRFYKLITGGR